MGLLHCHWTPVEAAVLKLLVRVPHKFICFLTAEWTEVREEVGLSSGHRLQQKRRQKLKFLQTQLLINKIWL